MEVLIRLAEIHHLTSMILAIYFTKEGKLLFTLDMTIHSKNSESTFEVVGTMLGYQ